MDFLRNHQLNIILMIQGICTIIALFILFTKNLTKSRKISIFCLEVSASLLLICDRFAYIYRGDVSQLGWWMVRISNFGVFCFSITIIYSFNLYLKDLLKAEIKLPKTPLSLILSDIFLVLSMFLLIISLFTKMYYTFDDTNHYHRANGIILCYLFPVIVLILQLYCILKHRKQLSKKILIPIILFTILPITATIFQIFMYGLSLTNIAISGMTVFIYIFEIQETNDKIERAHRIEVELLEKYKQELEITVEERTQELKIANEKAELILLNILPQDLKQASSDNPNKIISKKYPKATVLFADIVDFSKMRSTMSPEEIDIMLNKITSIFDERAKKEGIEKIKTIGGAYMAVSGLTENPVNNGAIKILKFAYGLIQDINNQNSLLPYNLQIRIGISTGELVAGVIGTTKFIYDIQGNTVNVANMMEISGKPMRIHVSQETYNQLKNFVKSNELERIEIKGKGLMTSYYL